MDSSVDNSHDAMMRRSDIGYIPNMSSDRHLKRPNASLRMSHNQYLQSDASSDTYEEADFDNEISEYDHEKPFYSVEEKTMSHRINATKQQLVNRK